MCRCSAFRIPHFRVVPVIGLPGYPVSAAITCELLVKPTLARWLGQVSEERPQVTAAITRKVVSPEGEEEFLRVTVGQVGDRVVATPLPGGSGVLMSLVRADGIVRIPRGEGGFEPGAPVTVELYRPPASIRRTIIAIGSHDLTLDLLADELGRRHPGWRLSSANVGSLGACWRSVAVRRTSPAHTCWTKRPASTISRTSSAISQASQS